MAALSMGLILATALAGPATANAPTADPIERLSGFSTIVINYLNKTIGSENLPFANGSVVQPGLFATIGPDALSIFDHEAVPLREGRVADATADPQCTSGCPASLFDAFQYEWLSLAVEGAALAIELPTRVLFAVDAKLPVSTLLQAAYAASESRPVRPPEIWLLVNSARGGLRAQLLYLLPPTGLELPQGSAALGLTVRIRQDGLYVEAADASLARSRRLATLPQLAKFLEGVKKSHPSKETIILVPETDMPISQLVQVMEAVREHFPRIVLSQGQDVII